MNQPVLGRSILVGGARPLSGFERIMVESGPVMGADLVVLRVEGTLDVDRLRHALALVQRRHAILHAHVDGDRLVVDGAAGPVGLEVLAPSVHDDRGRPAWESLVARLVGQPFHLSTPGALRAGWAPSPGGGHLVLAAHHALVDGPALFTLGRDVLAALAGTLPEDERPLPPEVLVDRWTVFRAPWMRPICERVWASGLRGHLRGPLLSPEGALAPGESPRTLVSFGEGPPGSAPALLAAARSRGLTVGAAFFTALRLAAAELQAADHRDPWRDALGVELQVGLRGRARQAPGVDDLGFAASGQRTRTRLRRRETFWGLAARLHRQVRFGLDVGVPEIAWQSVQPIVSLREALRRHAIDLDPVGGTGLLVAASNVGRWPHATTWGSLRLTGVWGLCGVSYAGPSSLSWLRSLGDRWFVDATGSAPFHGQARLDALLGHLQASLIAAAAGDPEIRPGG